MKKIMSIAFAAFLAAGMTATFADSCGSCPEKKGDKKECSAEKKAECPAKKACSAEKSDKA